MLNIQNILMLKFYFAGLEMVPYRNACNYVSIYSRLFVGKYFFHFQSFLVIKRRVKVDWSDRCILFWKQISGPVLSLSEHRCIDRHAPGLWQPCAGGLTAHLRVSLRSPWRWACWKGFRCACSGPSRASSSCFSSCSLAEPLLPPPGTSCRPLATRCCCCRPPSWPGRSDGKRCVTTPTNFMNTLNIW